MTSTRTPPMLLARMALVLAGLLLGVAPAAAIDTGIPNAAPPIDPQQVIGGQNAIDRGYQYQVRPVQTPPVGQPQSTAAPIIIYGGSGRPVTRSSARARRAAGRGARQRTRSTMPQSSIMAPETTPRRTKTRR